MSTSTSPLSDTTVALLWGNRWTVSGRPEPIVFGESRLAAEALLAYFEERGRPKRLRLLYQSPDFTSVPVACPNGNRATLQAALQSEWPAVADPARAWGYEPIIDGTTLLHFERETTLYGLVDELRTRGVVMDGVWPLASVLLLVPQESPEIVALTVVAVARGLTLVVRQTPAGAREAVSDEGEGAGILLASTVRGVGGDGHGSLCLVSFDETGNGLCERFADGQNRDRGHLGWADVIRTAQAIPASHPGQLLPPAKHLGATRIVTGLTVLAVAAAIVLGALTVRETLTQRSLAAEQAVAIQRLRSEVFTLRKNETEVARLRARLADARPRRIACATLMRTLVRDLPAQIVLTALTADRDGFRLSGGVSGSGLSDKAWEKWMGQLKAPGLAWELVSPLPLPPTADFTLKGGWR